LIIRKIIEIAATRCRILKLKCTKFDFGWGLAPDPAERAYSAPQALAGFKGLILLRERRMGRKGKGERGRENRRRKGREGRRREEKREKRKGKGRGRVASWLLGDGRLCFS